MNVVGWLEDVEVDPSILELQPDYCVGLMAVDGLNCGPTDAESSRALERAEHTVRDGQTTEDSDRQVELWQKRSGRSGRKPTGPAPASMHFVGAPLVTVCLE